VIQNSLCALHDCGYLVLSAAGLVFVHSMVNVDLPELKLHFGFLNILYFYRRGRLLLSRAQNAVGNWKMRDRKMPDQNVGVENAGPKMWDQIAGGNGGPD